MTWRVLTTPACESDFQVLRDEDRTAVVEDLFAWVAKGPPRSAPRLVGGAVLFLTRSRADSRSANSSMRRNGMWPSSGSGRTHQPEREASIGAPVGRPGSIAPLLDPLRVVRVFGCGLERP